MQLNRPIFLQRSAWALVLALLSAGSLTAQTRVTLPTGTVLLVRTETALQSNLARVGQTFETTVVEPISVEGYTVIPANSRVRGVVSYVQPASGNRSGVMQVDFNRITLPNGSASTMTAKLTSTDSTERRQIDARSDSRVVLVGERGGIGAGIAGAGSKSSAAAGILAALGNMLSEGLDVNVPAGTTLAVQLEGPITLTGIGVANLNDERTIFTGADRIRAAQQELARRGFYRGSVNGTLDYATRRALFDFQLRNNLTATGNLTGRTAAALGINAGGSGGLTIGVREAGVLRLAAQSLETRQRQELRITTTNQLDSQRSYTAAELELMFALSAFADNALLYEQVRTTSRNREGEEFAGRALLAAARRVDAVITSARPSQALVDVWASIRRQLAQIDPAYRP